ncbi:hypothetical protein [Vibrio sp. WXL210]|uniref:hypothetical protein n=1 Tax=Vibrio sp. WXL210 TaxID=3450709 RepID=UPI003EC4E762
MAAQPLTKARIAQILITLAVLMTAFWWRTVAYNQAEQGSVKCTLGEACKIEAGVTIAVLRTEQGTLLISGLKPTWQLTGAVGTNLQQTNDGYLVPVENEQLGEIKLKLTEMDNQRAIDLIIALD